MASEITRVRVTTIRGGPAGWEASDGELGDLEAEMTSATHESRDEGYGLVVFAAMLLG